MLRGRRFYGKIVVLTLNDDEENVLDNIIAALTDKIKFEEVQPIVSPVLSFPGLEIRQHQRRVLRDGSDIYLTRLEYGTLLYLASYPGMVLSQEQIFEAVWSMDSDSCQSSVVNVIYNLRKKIEPDSKNPTYIKTVIGIGYKFDMQRSG